MIVNEESALLLDRRYTCPVCHIELKSKSVKTGAAKLIDTALDLRPMYQNIDVIKYDVVLCPNCGYAALAKDFPNLLPVQVMYLHDKVALNYNSRTTDYEVYSYEYAMERFKLAIISTIVKQGYPSELGFICLKISWMYQNRMDALTKEDLDFENQKKQYEIEALDYSKKALEHLMKARMEEDYPILGMDMPTLDYLIAALCEQDGQLELALRMLGTVSVSREANERLKYKAYDLKERINKRMKQENNKS